jgi:hypothetical protein
MNITQEQKFLYETLIPREIEEYITEKRIENDKEVEVKKKVKDVKKIKVAILKPNRKLYKNAELFLSKTLANYLREGVMPYSLVAKRYANDGGPLTEAEVKKIDDLKSQLSIYEKEFFTTLATSPEENTTVKKSDVLMKINKLNSEISAIQNAYADIFDNTAEIKSRNDTVEWWSLFLIYIDEDNKGYKPIFGDLDYEGRMNKLEDFEDKSIPFYTEIIKRLSYLISFWFTARVALTLEDFKTMEQLYIDSYSDYKVIDSPESIEMVTS